MSKVKVERRRRIRHRIRKKIVGTNARPRLSVFRSNKGIYCQLIDDSTGKTLAQANWKEKGPSSITNKIDQAKEIGKLIADRAKSMEIDRVVFDRGGYLYHGRVKAVADGAREAGLTL